MGGEFSLYSFVKFSHITAAESLMIVITTEAKSNNKAGKGNLRRPPVP